MSREVYVRGKGWVKELPVATSRKDLQTVESDIMGAIGRAFIEDPSAPMMTMISTPETEARRAEIEKVKRTDKELGITRAVRKWAKHTGVYYQLKGNWAPLFAELPEEEKVAWEALTHRNPDVLPRWAQGYGDSDYQPSLAELIEWRDKEATLIAAAQIVDYPHATDQQMLAYYNEQLALAQQMKPL